VCLTGAEQELPKVDGEPREQLCPAQNRSGGGGSNGSGRVYEVEAVVNEQGRGSTHDRPAHPHAASNMRGPDDPHPINPSWRMAKKYWKQVRPHPSLIHPFPRGQQLARPA
jgi:hypothetical protein